jgi:8-oxo-dGTP pyrophosphatase MutT (NUDIX family)
VLVEEPEAVLLIRRADRVDDRWSGQMAFPGGRWSEGDADLLETARRETIEEVGLDLRDAPVLGVLDDIAPRTPVLPPLIVRPFVFRLGRPRPLVPNHEVAGALWAELERLAAPGVYRPFEYDFQGARLVLPGYHLAEGIVWGMTERILTPLLALLRQEGPG